MVPFRPKTHIFAEFQQIKVYKLPLNINNYLDKITPKYPFKIQV